MLAGSTTSGSPSRDLDAAIALHGGLRDVVGRPARWSREGVEAVLSTGREQVECPASPQRGDPVGAYGPSADPGWQQRRIPGGRVPGQLATCARAACSIGRAAQHGIRGSRVTSPPRLVGRRAHPRSSRPSEGHYTAQRISIGLQAQRAASPASVTDEQLSKINETTAARAGTGRGEERLRPAQPATPRVRRPRERQKHRVGLPGIARGLTRSREAGTTRSRWRDEGAHCCAASYTAPTIRRCCGQVSCAEASTAKARATTSTSSAESC